MIFERRKSYEEMVISSVGRGYGIGDAFRLFRRGQEGRK